MPTYFNENTQTWYCKFYYRDFMGKNHQKKKGGFQLQKEAREWERSFIRQHEGGPDMTFCELYEIYERDMQNRLRYSTMFTKKHLIKTKLLPYLGDLPINKIQPCTIREWQNLMRSYKDENGKGYSETYLKSMNNQLSAILNYAVRYYQLTANPCHAAGSMGKKQVSHGLFWSPNEFHAFLKYFPNDSGRWLVFSILYYTGIRIGELLALTHDDFYPDKGILTINKTYRRIDKKDYIAPPKTPKSLRVVALPPFLNNKLNIYIQKKVSYASKRIFTYSKYYITKYMQEGCKATGVSRIRIHDLRHSHASLLIEHGFSPLLIAERLGHENIETTLNTYGHLYPHRQSELAANLQSLYLTYDRQGD